MSIVSEPQHQQGVALSETPTFSRLIVTLEMDKFVGIPSE
jgi:hypothetical protein